MSEPISRAVSVVALVMALYQIFYIFFTPWSNLLHIVIHTGLALIVIYLEHIASLREQRTKQLLYIFLTVATVITISFMLIHAERFEMMFGMGLDNIDILMATAMIVITIIATWIKWGRVIPLIVIVSLVYFFFGYLLPGPLRAPKLTSVGDGLAYLAAGGETGVFGQVTPVSANVVFLFMLFGGLLSTSGVLAMFLELGKFLGRRIRGGTAFTSIIGSSLLGTVTGATVANVALGGAFTIPAMKDQGYKPEQAGAIEAVSSCGGQIMPPVMGAGAFVMASFLGIPYAQIALMAVLPAILYYIAITFAILFMARRSNIGIYKMTVNYRVIYNNFLVFVVPIGILIYMLIAGNTVEYAIGWAMLALFATIFIRKESFTNPRSILIKLRETAHGLVVGARQGADIAVVLIAISIVAQVLITGAAAPKLAATFTFLSGDNILLGLVFAMLACIILGFGLPTVAAYTLVAIMMIPTLTALGVDRVSAHFFVFFFAVYAAVSPPIATAVIVASRIAASGFWTTAWLSMRLMIVPLIIPYVIIYKPSILAFDAQGLLTLVVVLALSLIISALVEQYCFKKMSFIDNFLALIVLALSIIFILMEFNNYLIVSVLCLTILFCIKQWIEFRTQQAIRAY